MLGQAGRLGEVVVHVGSQHFGIGQPHLPEGTGEECLGGLGIDDAVCFGQHRVLYANSHASRCAQHQHAIPLVTTLDDVDAGFGADSEDPCPISLNEVEHQRPNKKARAVGVTALAC
ncbi:Uncharacterised protein [Mycobacteroides abscessus subsp. abscessus]|nr:Uncharacterised protein [Mycobacteroides abscessus subsp. abscessus]